MHKAPTVGIVIPIYNVEQYLIECIDSVLNQDYTNYIVLLVNDGSTDSSMDIAMDYVKKDSRFILIDKRNGGLSSARNVGIDFFANKYIYEESSAPFSIENDNPYWIKKIYMSNDIVINIDYLIFLDSDDYWERDCLSTCVKYMLDSKADLLWFDWQYKYEYEMENKYTSLIRQMNINESYKTTSLELLERNVSAGIHDFYCSWSLFIDFSFLQRIALRFIDNIVHEDVAFNTSIIAQSGNIYIYPKPLYVYRIRKNSIMTGDINIPEYIKSLYAEFDDIQYAKKYHRIASLITMKYSLLQTFESLNAENSYMLKRYYVNNFDYETMPFLENLTKDPWNIKESVRSIEKLINSDLEKCSYKKTKTQIIYEFIKSFERNIRKALKRK